MTERSCVMQAACLTPCAASRRTLARKPGAGGGGVRRSGGCGRRTPPTAPYGPRRGRAHSIQVALRAGVWVTATSLSPVTLQESGQQDAAVMPDADTAGADWVSTQPRQAGSEWRGIGSIRLTQSLVQAAD